MRRKNKFAVVTCLKHRVKLYITLFTFCQMTVGVGSPDTGTSSLSLFPATTTIVSGDWPRQSRWILGGSIVKADKISFKHSLINTNGKKMKKKIKSCIKLKMKKIYCWLCYWKHSYLKINNDWCSYLLLVQNLS